VLVYNTKLPSGSSSSSSSEAGAEAAAAAVAAAVPRLQAVLNPGGALLSTQLELSRADVADELAGFVQRAAAEAKQHQDVPRSLPEEYLSGG